MGRRRAGGIVRVGDRGVAIESVVAVSRSDGARVCLAREIAVRVVQ